MLTPVFPDDHTLSLLRNQLRTFAAFVEVDSFAAWLMVCPAQHLPALRAFLDGGLPDLPPALDDIVSGLSPHPAFASRACFVQCWRECG